MTRRFARTIHSFKFVALFIATFSTLALFATPATGQNPVPFVSQPFVPDAAAPGGAGFTLTVNGTGFVSGSIVNWNGSPRATNFVSNSQLTVTILASDIATASTASVTVVSPIPGGGSSNIVFFPINTPATTITFGTTDYTVGLNPTYAAATDFSGDGRLDLAVPNYGSSSVSVMVGNGDGTFQSPVDYPVGSGPQGEVVGDFRGNGKLDLAVTYQLVPSSIDVLLGNGDGTFQPAISYPVGNGATYAFTADVNGDGNLDLLVVNQYDATVSVLLGNGDGTFRAQVANDVGGTTPTGAAIGDFNGDGKLDIAVSNWGSNTVSVLLGNGDGTFQPAVAYPAGTSPGGVNIADINGDGILDLLVPNQGSANVSVLLGKGDGTFAAQVEYPVAAGANRAELGDFNQDGKLDLAVATVKPSLDLLLGNGDGTFQPSLSFPTVASPWNVVVGDFNQDGRLDAAVPGSTDASTIAVMLQTVKGTKVPYPSRTAVATSGSPSLVGQPVTFTATVTSIDGAIPDGEQVTFDDGSALIGTGTTASGVATFTTSLLPGKTNTIRATYTGDAIFARSIGSVTQVVDKNTTTTALVSSLNPSVYGQSVNWTATVSSTGPNTPTGRVRFVGLGYATLSGGVATFTNAWLNAGTYAITAEYEGDSASAASVSAVLNQVVNPASTTTVITSSADPSTLGQNVTFTATVTSSTGAHPTGTVTFTATGMLLGTVPLEGTVATFSTAALPVASFAIAATYNGATDFTGSSDSLIQSVEP